MLGSKIEKSKNFKKKLICFFINTLDGGGAERALISLANQISKDNYPVDLVVGDSNVYEKEVTNSINLIDFETRSVKKLFYKFLIYANKKKPFIIVSALDGPNIIASLIRQFSPFNGRLILCQRAILFCGWAEFSTFKKCVFRILLSFSMRKADAIICNSDYAAKQILDEWNIDVKKVFSINNFIDVRNIQFHAQESLSGIENYDHNRKLIISVGSLYSIKDRITLIKAYLKIKSKTDAQLIILGEGEERARIESFILENGLHDDVLLPGWVQNPYNWISQADVLVSSSETEGCPNNILEALYLNTPIVATDCPGGTNAILENGKWGKLVDVGDYCAMGQAILDTLNNNKPVKTMAYAEVFSQRSIIDEYLSVINNLAYKKQNHLYDRI